MISLQYSRALYELSVDCLDNVLDDFSSFLSLLESKEIFAFFKSPVVKKEDKKNVLRQSLRGVNPILLDFLYTLIDNNRMEIVNLIYDDFEKIASKEKGIAVIDVYTANPLTELQEMELVKVLGPKISKRININNIIDASVLGGIRVEYQGVSIDQTIQTLIKKMKALM